MGVNAVVSLNFNLTHLEYLTCYPLPSSNLSLYITVKINLHSYKLNLLLALYFIDLP